MFTNGLRPELALDEYPQSGLGFHRASVQFMARSVSVRSYTLIRPKLTRPPPPGSSRQSFSLTGRTASEDRQDQRCHQRPEARLP
jgi:hypothetical protein